MTTVNLIRLVIHLEGGIVQAVYSNSFPVKFVVMDMDTDGADDDEITVLENGVDFIGRIDQSMQNPDIVANAFQALNEEIPRQDIRQSEYVAKGGNQCPHCGGDNVEYQGGFNIDGVIASFEASCVDCDSSWIANYRLEGFTELDVVPDELT